MHLLFGKIGEGGPCTEKNILLISGGVWYAKFMKFLYFTWLLAFLWVPSSWSDSRLGLRLGAAQFEGTSQNETIRNATGSKTYVFAPDISYLYAIDQKLMVGTGFDVYYSAGNLDLWGLRFFGRYYISGAAKPLLIKKELLEFKQMPKHNTYVGAEFRRYHYSLGTNPTQLGEYELEGQYYNISMMGGYELTINPQFNYNAELSYSPLTFSSTDDRIVARGLIVYFGINYFFSTL